MTIAKVKRFVLDVSELFEGWTNHPSSVIRQLIKLQKYAVVSAGIDRNANLDRPTELPLIDRHGTTVTKSVTSNVGTDPMLTVVSTVNLRCEAMGGRAQVTPNGRIDNQSPAGPTLPDEKS